MSEYLAAFDAAPEAEKSRLVRRWIDTEALPFFKILRAERPVLVTPLGTLVARYSDVTDVLSQPKVFTTALYVPKQGNGLYLMSHDDDPLHTREKALMQGLLNRDDLPAVRALVARLCHEILDGSPENRVEAAYGYCRSVPAGLVQNYFGLTGIDREKLVRWSYWAQYDTFHNQPFDLRKPAIARSSTSIPARNPPKAGRMASCRLAQNKQKARLHRQPPTLQAGGRCSIKNASPVTVKTANLKLSSPRSWLSIRGI